MHRKLAYIESVEEKPKWNIGSNKQLFGQDRQKMQDLVDYLNTANLVDKRSGEQLEFFLEDGWEDYGARMMWTAPCYITPTYNVWALTPRQWLDYMNDEESAEDIINDFAADKYSSIKRG